MLHLTRARFKFCFYHDIWNHVLASAASFFQTRLLVFTFFFRFCTRRSIFALRIHFLSLRFVRCFKNLCIYCSFGCCQSVFKPLPSMLLEDFRLKCKLVKTMVSFVSDTEEKASGCSSLGTNGLQSLIEFTFEGSHQCMPWRD